MNKSPEKYNFYKRFTEEGAEKVVLNIKLN
jgi:hypothetical protein